LESETKSSAVNKPKTQPLTPEQAKCRHVFGDWTVKPARWNTDRLLYQHVCKKCGYMQTKIEVRLK